MYFISTPSEHVYTCQAGMGVWKKWHIGHGRAPIAKGVEQIVPVTSRSKNNQEPQLKNRNEPERFEANKPDPEWVLAE